MNSTHWLYRDEGSFVVFVPVKRSKVSSNTHEVDLRCILSHSWRVLFSFNTHPITFILFIKEKQNKWANRFYPAPFSLPLKPLLFIQPICTFYLIAFENSSVSTDTVSLNYSLTIEGENNYMTSSVSTSLLSSLTLAFKSFITLDLIGDDYYCCTFTLYQTLNEIQRTHKVRDFWQRCLQQALKIHQRQLFTNQEWEQCFWVK